MTASYDEWLRGVGADRERRGLARALHPRRAGDAIIDVASNDYLGLASDQRVIEAAVAATREWGAGSTGSRLVTGTTDAHVECEAELAGFLQSPAALVLASGYAANLAALTALGGADTLIVSDADNHASIVDACRLSRSRVVVSPHREVAAVQAAIARRAEPRAIVVVDAVFSTDGSLAPLADLHQICQDHDALLVVDEAHSVGVIGPGGQGLVVAAGLADTADVIRTVTLSKALGSQGGAILGSAAVRDHVINTARAFIFDTGLAPACVGAATAALRVLRSEPHLVAQVHHNAGLIAAALDVPRPEAAVVSLILGDPALAVNVAEHCREAGVLVGCFRPPSVPVGQSRLRLTARASLTETEVKQATTTVLDAIDALR